MQTRQHSSALYTALGTRAGDPKTCNPQQGNLCINGSMCIGERACEYLWNSRCQAYSHPLVTSRIILQPVVSASADLFVPYPPLGGSILRDYSTPRGRANRWLGARLIFLPQGCNDLDWRGIYYHRHVKIFSLGKAEFLYSRKYITGTWPKKVK